MTKTVDSTDIAQKIWLLLEKEIPAEVDQWPVAVALISILCSLMQTCATAEASEKALEMVIAQLRIGHKTCSELRAEEERPVQ